MVPTTDVMLSVRNGEKEEREQYFEGVTVISLALCIVSYTEGVIVRGRN